MNECLTAETKENIINELSLLFPDGELMDTVSAVINDVPDCTSKEKKKRKPSDYNKFMSTCLKEVNQESGTTPQEAMKKCSIRWSEKKK